MNASTNVQTSVRERLLPWALPCLLLVGLVVRLPLLGNDGFRNDVQAFESWALTIAEHGPSHFYANAGFADYPPGYFYVLGVVGAIWEWLFRGSDPSYSALKVLVKLPAVFADLGVGAILYAIARRFTSQVSALGVAALYVLNPAVIFISAIWGQVDSIAAGFALLGVYFLMRGGSRDATRPELWIVGAWLSLAYSLLVKPQAALLIPLFLAFAFLDRARTAQRLRATAIGILAAVLLAVLLSIPFHPSNPVAALLWLLQRFAFGSNVYPYNSVNAFNLWAIRGSLWQPDTVTILGLPQFVWGIVLALGATGLAVWRYCQDGTDRSLLESCAIVTLAFFVLATRMHERYVFDGVVFTIACVPLAKRYLWCALILSAVLFANLQYSLQYLAVMSAQNAPPGVDAHNLWGVGTSLLALATTGTFFYLGYAFLGSSDEAAAAAGERGAPPVAPIRLSSAAYDRGRGWFDPLEGLAAFRKPLDYLVMGALGLFSFGLSFVQYWNPPDKIFDEVYFARAAEEYLTNQRIYENTHPPLTKLIITLSVMLFGGMPHGHGLGGWTGLNAIVGHMPSGDNSYGWRFFDVVFGALVVMLLFAFAKRVTGSTVFGAIAASFLVFDGMHFVQSRIGTPEGIVVFFSLAAVYAFYRFWISSQTIVRRHVDAAPGVLIGTAGISLIAGLAAAGLWHLVWPDLDRASFVIATIYVAVGAYLALRYLAVPVFFGDGRSETTYPEGSHAIGTGSETVVYAVDGGVLSAKAVQRGALSRNVGGKLVYEGGDLTISYRRDGAVTYESPVGEATYADGRIVAGDANESGRSSRLWLLAFTLALGALVSSKWYGVMGFGVSFFVLAAVWLQPVIFERKPLVWGNPRGFRLDAALATIVFVSATVYGLVWVPDLLRHAEGEIANFNDVVERQYSMFEYHETLKATHPYSSKWWEWPLDYVPVAYYYEDHRNDIKNDKACCVTEVTSMPNPFNMWFGLLCVPIVGWLAWRERNKGYALIVITYLFQWVPWSRSPRLAWEYHFYVNIPLICLCNAIVLQRVWQFTQRQENPAWRWAGGAAVGAVVAAIAGAFVFFYPVLSAQPIPWDAWHQRMWIDKWVIGPG